MGNPVVSKRSYKSVLSSIAAAIRPTDEQQIVTTAESATHSRLTLLSVTHIIRQVKLLVAVLRDPSYSISWQTRALVLAALTYFVLPTDLTPDYIPVVGFLDDGVVLTIVIKRLNSELERYRSHTPTSSK